MKVGQLIWITGNSGDHIKKLLIDFRYKEVNAWLTVQPVWRACVIADICGDYVKILSAGTCQVYTVNILDLSCKPLDLHSSREGSYIHDMLGRMGAQYINKRDAGDLESLYTI